MFHAATPKPHFKPAILRCFPSNLSRSISTLHHDQTPIKSSLPFITHNERLLAYFDLLLRHCSTLQHVKQIHAEVIVTGNCGSAFLAARFVSAYARFGRHFDAQKVFDFTPFESRSNFLLWNSVLRANVSRGYFENGLKLYVEMRKIGFFGDGFTFPLVIRACAYVGSSFLCRVVHGHVLEMGFESRLHVANELMGMYSKLGRMGDARKVFDRMGVRSHVSWNMMISGYAFNHDCDGAVEMFQRMESEGFEPNLVTWTSLISSHVRSYRYVEAMELFGFMRMKGIELSAEVLAVVLSICINLGEFERGKIVHGYVVKDGFENYSFVKNALIAVYGKCGDVNDAQNLFMETENKNIISWNALITSYAEAGLCDEALELFSEMGNSDGCSAFRPNVVSWSALISGFAAHGREEESLELFRQMQLADVMPNVVTISSVLSVCAEFAALNLGREIHGHVIRASMNNNILVENGLVNMYAKCGCLKEGCLVFEKIEKKDLIAWNSMITGYGMHGLGSNALATFDQMTKSGTKPNGVTFVAVLSACSHAGLVPEGRKLFDQMLREYRIKPQIEHYACIVDLLGRAGLLQEASNIVKNMPMEPNICIWSALLNSCRMHKNTEVAENTASHISSLETEVTGSYMLLSNIYSASGRWEDSARVRASTRTKGLKKNPGQSWIEVKKTVYMFSAGNPVQKDLEEVYATLEDLTFQMESERRVTNSSIIPQIFDGHQSGVTGVTRC